MTQDSRHYYVTDGEFEDDTMTEFSRVRGSTWRAAAPYLAGALLSWAAGGYSQYQLMKLYSSQMSSPDGANSSILLRQSLFQSMSQVLFYAGCGLFLIGLLIGVLRQHERWRRDLDLSLEDTVADGGVVSMQATAPPEAAIPLYAQSVWDTPTNEVER